MGFCDFKDVVTFGNNQLWRPLAAKVKGHHSGLPQKNGQLIDTLQQMQKFVLNMFS